VILLQIPDQQHAVDVAAVGIRGADLQLPELATEVLPAAAVDLVAEYVRDQQPDSAAGSVHRVTLPGLQPSTVLLVGLGDGTPDNLRIAAVALGRRIRDVDEGRSVAVAIDAADEAASRALAEGLVLGGYTFTLAANTDEPLHTVQIAGAVDRAGLIAGDAAADAAGWARDLGNTPASILTPQRMGELAAEQLTPAGCTVQIHDENWLAARGFGGVVAVGSGSVSPPRLIEVSYRPRGSARGPHVVLVGKGITFDTGGLNLKPPAAMRMMHTDMCGGAAVLAALHAVALRKIPIRVTVLVPAAENAVSAKSMRPSDVIYQYGGRTTEIGNTDAEGRLVLADALAYAVDRLKPTVMIDVATLTGAMKVALGLLTAGYFANDDELAGRLEAASVVTGESIWRMPLEHRYLNLLDSPVADARNDPGNPGGITAALFLQPFVGDVPWAHLDIAGPARATEEGEIFSRGATGFGARLLARYLEDLV
jgi:leucyl aminopeptidase